MFRFREFTYTRALPFARRAVLCRAGPVQVELNTCWLVSADDGGRTGRSRWSVAVALARSHSKTGVRQTSPAHSTSVMLARGSSMPCEARCSPGNLVLAERLSSRSRPRVKTCGADVRRRRRPLHRSSVVMAAISESCCRDLLVVGPGVLGSLVCQRWLKVRALASSRRSRARRARSTTDLDPRRFFSVVSQRERIRLLSRSRAARTVTRRRSPRRR